MKMDLNSDLGESFSAWHMGDDAAMLGIVSSANVACGFHAGDAVGILRTLRHAKD
ncbi:MAG: LamB/YcsF family protein, partial [Comamonadaceae bacterium]